MRCGLCHWLLPLPALTTEDEVSLHTCAAYFLVANTAPCSPARVGKALSRLYTARAHVLRGKGRAGGEGRIASIQQPRPCGSVCLSATCVDLPLTTCCRCCAVRMVWAPPLASSGGTPQSTRSTAPRCLAKRPPELPTVLRKLHAPGLTGTRPLRRLPRQMATLWGQRAHLQRRVRFRTGARRRPGAAGDADPHAVPAGPGRPGGVQPAFR